MTLVAAIFTTDDPPIAVTMCGQALPVTAFADADGVVCPAEEARFCTAGPDSAGALWLIDVRQLRRRR